MSTDLDLQWTRRTLDRLGVQDHPLCQYVLGQLGDQAAGAALAANDLERTETMTTPAGSGEWAVGNGGGTFPYSLLPTPLLLDGVEVGQRTPDGAYLDRAVFDRLGLVARIRAYLLLVYPASRQASQIARVCRTTANKAVDTSIYLMDTGLVQRETRACYALSDPARQGSGDLWRRRSRTQGDRHA